MKSYCIKLWDNACTFSRASGNGFIETLYLSAPSITAAIAKALKYAKAEDYSSCRVVDAVELDEKVI